jgi:hypothetical protein
MALWCKNRAAAVPFCLLQFALDGTADLMDVIIAALIFVVVVWPGCGDVVAVQVE